MATERIDDIVSSEAFAQLEKVKSELKEAEQALIRATKEAKSFDTALRQSKGLLDIQKQIEEGSKAMDKLSKEGQKIISVAEKMKAAQKVATDSLVAYNEQVKKLTNEYNALGSSEEKDLQRKAAIRKEVLSLTAAFSGQKKAIQDAKKGIDAAERSYYELQNETAKLSKQLKSMPGAFDATTGAINKNNKEAVLMADQIKTNNDLLKKYDASLGQHFRNVGNYAQAANGIKNYLTFLTGFAGTAFIAASATRAVIDSNIEISDSLTEVQRVAGMTKSETDDLYDSLKQINTRTSMKGLLDLSRIGAQLGVSKKDLSGFTTALNELYVVLGNEISGGPKGIATGLSKVINLLDIGQQYGVQKGLEKTGSAILAVGQAGIATGDYLTDFAQRVGGVAKVAHISLPDLLGYGSTLEANGVTAELAGTSFSRLIVQLGRVPEKFYAIAKAADPKLTLEQFTNYINTDANKALQLFFQGMTKSGTSLTDFARISKSLGLPGQRLAQVLAAIATNQQDVSHYTEIANQAFNDGTLILDQYKLKNDNLAGSFEELKNTIINTFTAPQSIIGNFFKNTLQELTKFVRDATYVLNSSKPLTRLFQGLSHEDESGNRVTGPLGELITRQLKKPELTSDQLRQLILVKNAFSTGPNENEKQNLTNLLVSAGTQANASGKYLANTKNSLGITGGLDDIIKYLQDNPKANQLLNYTVSATRDEAYFNSLLSIFKKNFPGEKIPIELSDYLNASNAIEEQINNQLKALESKIPLKDRLKGIKVNDLSKPGDKPTKPSDLQAQASKQIALDKQIRDAQIKNAQKEADAERRIQEEKLQFDIDTQKQIMQDGDRSFDERLAAFKKYVEDERQLIETQKNNQINAIKDAALAQALKQKQDQALLDARKDKGRPLTKEEADAALANLTSIKDLPDDVKKAAIDAYANQIAEINLKAAKKAADLTREATKEGISMIGGSVNSDTQKQNDELQANAAKELVELNNKYREGLITEKAYNKTREDITYRTNADILENNLSSIDKAIEGYRDKLKEQKKDKSEQANYEKDINAQILKAEQKKEEVKRQLSDLTTEHVIENEKRKREAVLSTLQGIQQYGDQILGILETAAENRATAQKNALQDQIDAINEAKETEINSINESLLSQQDKADKIAIVNAQAQAQTEAIARRQKEIDQEQARYNKARAIFDIILNTAVGITKALASANIPLSIAIGFAGAAELMVASAAPIPQYAKGRKDGPAEFAVVGEKGTELIQYPDGKQALTPDNPTIAFLPEHAIVKPHNETIIELAKQAGVNAMRNIPVFSERDLSSQYMSSIDRKMDSLENAVRNIPIQQTNFSWTEQGVRKWVVKGVALTKYINGIKH